MKSLARFVMTLCFIASIIGVIFFAANDGGKEAIWSFFAAIFFGFLRVVLATDDANGSDWIEPETRL
jgi:hypothetical protein